MKISCKNNCQQCSEKPWATKYNDLAKTQQKKECIYLVAIFLLVSLAIIFNYNDFFKVLFSSPEQMDNYDTLKRIIYCLLFGLFGGITFGLKSFYRYVARGEWECDRVYWRILSPIISLSVTVSIILLMHKQVFSSKLSVACFISYLAGYFSENAVGKMCDIANLVLGPAPKKEDKNS